jgi:pyruvate kinase
MLRTKIVCTLGPSTDSDDVLAAIIRSGMTVARLNFSHGTHADHTQRIARVRRVAAALGIPIAVMGDLQGPKFRIGNLPSAGIDLPRGSFVTLFAGHEFDPAHPDRVPFPHAEVLAALSVGRRLLIDDGVIELQVVERIGEHEVRCATVDEGRLLPRKGVSAPGVEVAVSSITDKDCEDLAFAVEQGVQAIALSFVRTAHDVRELRSMIAAHGGSQLIVSKIEKPEALVELDAIIDESDVVMVARGDLGVEAPPEEVPFYQKRIIRHCRRAGKPVITATQMLQSMVRESVPTRAEASDVANAVLDGTDAVMLSAETATGAHPVEAVAAMARIALRAEGHAVRRNIWRLEHTRHEHTAHALPTDSITLAAVNIAREIGARAVVCATRSGQTSRMVARNRPAAPILSLTTTQRALDYAAFLWGVRAVTEPSVLQNTDLLFDASERIVKELGLAAAGDSIVIVAGVPLGAGAGTTNMIKVEIVR